MKRLLFAVSFLLPLALAVGCQAPESTDPQADIIGKWETRGGAMTLEFTEAGKLDWVITDGGFVNEGTADIAFVGDDRMLGMWEMNLQTWSVSIRGDRLHMEGDDGRELDLRRAG